MNGRVTLLSEVGKYYELQLNWEKFQLDQQKQISIRLRHITKYHAKRKHVLVTFSRNTVLLAIFLNFA